MRYRPDLDGIRAIAVLAVVASHFVGLAGGGWMGVDVFFVLSGYLITALLLAEHERSGRVALGRFYARRALRLYPALLLALLLGLPFYRQLGDGGTLLGYGREMAVAGLYLEDFAIGLFHHPLVGFPHTWSLAIEEQFYLLWPPLLAWLLTRRRDPLPVAIAGTLVSWGLLAALTGPSPLGIPDTYFLPWSRFSQLLLGCCVAIVLQRRVTPTWVRRPVIGWVLAAAAIALVYVAGRTQRDPSLIWEAPAIALVTGALIVHLQDARTGLRRVLGVRPLAAIGRRSYGIYLIHYPVILLLDPRLPLGPYGNRAVALTVSLVLAFASYRLVELPFLRLKSRFGPPTTKMPTTKPPTTKPPPTEGHPSPETVPRPADSALPG